MQPLKKVQKISAIELAGLSPRMTKGIKDEMKNSATRLPLL